MKTSGAVQPGVGRLAPVFARHVTSVMAPETRTRRDGRAVVPPPEVRVPLEELAVPPVVQHVVPRAAAAQLLRDRCG